MGQETNLNENLKAALEDDQTIPQIKITQPEVPGVLDRLTELRHLLGFTGEGMNAERTLIEAIAKIRRLDLSVNLGDLMQLRTENLPEIKANLIARKVDPIGYVQNLLELISSKPDSLDSEFRKQSLLVIVDLLNDGVFTVTPVQFTTISMWLAYMTTDSLSSEKRTNLANQMLKIFAHIRVQPVMGIDEGNGADVSYAQLTPEIAKAAENI